MVDESIFRKCWSAATHPSGRYILMRHDATCTSEPCFKHGPDVQYQRPENVPGSCAWELYLEGEDAGSSGACSNINSHH